MRGKKGCALHRFEAWTHALRTRSAGGRRRSPHWARASLPLSHAARSESFGGVLTLSGPVMIKATIVSIDAGAGAGACVGDRVADESDGLREPADAADGAAS